MSLTLELSGRSGSGLQLGNGRSGSHPGEDWERAPYILSSQVATVPAMIPNEDDGAPGLSLLETGDGRWRIARSILSFIQPSSLIGCNERLREPPGGFLQTP